MPSLPQELKGSCCILHIDLDCFYCQVEQVRLGIPSDVPAAVQQWNTLIAVNYPARKAGVARHSTTEEAKELCPEIKFMHVPTYAADEREPCYRENPDRSTQKVSLDPYRTASRKIFLIFYKYCSKLQKIGLDEAFMDVTETVNKRLMTEYMDRWPQLLEKVNDKECGLELDWDQVGITIESKEEEQRKETFKEKRWSKATWKDLQLYIGAKLAAEIRNEIFETLKFTCSAGIAHYKSVAKLCSSRNKPNKQTILRLSATSDFMETIPFTKIRNLGGKLGSEIESDLSIDKASDLWPYSMEDLQKRFGTSTGRYLYHICRGMDHEEIIPSKAPKSIMASKSFNPVVEDLNEMNRWFSILAIELHNRIMQNLEEYNTWPKTFSLHYASIPYLSFRSKVIGSITKDEMKNTGTMPCSGIQFQASGMGQAPSSSHSIQHFFTKAANNTAVNNTVTINDRKSQKTGKIVVETKKKKNDLNSFWKSPPAKSTSSTEWMCDKCSKKILLKNVDEHTDYHFALELQEQHQREEDMNTHRSVSTSDSTNKRENSDNEGSKNKKKKLFFSS
ncbi:hypothetical protein G6F60_002507 [Rhizopus arrhizus]|nr:hypothetical protein G6F60_002507 [Rhizopus arrhizus]